MKLAASTDGAPRDDPVFGEPWQAHAFALTLRLHERGLFTWSEWADALSRQIAAAQAAGDADLGDTYYRHWMAALETLVVATGASSDSAAARPASRARPRRRRDRSPGSR